MANCEESCGYCLQKLPYMEDPRLLPCSHLFCLPCLKEDLEQSEVFKCIICSCLHEDMELENLSSISKTATREGDVLAAPCDVCENIRHPSVCYCTQCMKNICEEHLRVHKIFAGVGHFVVHHREKVDETVSKACSSCLKMFNNSCDAEPTCNAAEDGEQKHQMVGIEELAGQLLGKVTEALKNLSDKITKLCKQEKTAWNDVDDVKEKVEELKAEVERVAANQILEVTKKSESLKAELDEYLQKLMEETEVHTAILVSRAECMQNLWNTTRKLSTTSNAGILSSYTRITSPESKELLLSEVPEVERNVKDLLYSPPLPDNLLSVKRLTTHKSKFPSLLKLLGTVQLSNTSSLHWNRGELIVSCRDSDSPVYVYNKKLEKVQHLSDSPGIIALKTLPQTGFENYRYATILDSVGIEHSMFAEAYKMSLEMATADFKTRKSLDCVEISSQFTRCCGVAVHPLTHQIFVANSLQPHLTVYDSDGDYQMELQVSCDVDENPADIKILPDSSILVLFTKVSAVGKFEISADMKTLRKVWLNTAIQSISDVAYDTAGYIYATSNGGKCICILSPTGKLVGKLFHQQFRDSTLHHIAISGSLVAVGTDGRLHLMRMLK